MEVINIICQYLSHLENSAWSVFFDLATGTMKRVVNKHSTVHNDLKYLMAFKRQQPVYPMVVLVFDAGSLRFRYTNAYLITLCEDESDLSDGSVEGRGKYYLQLYAYEDPEMRGEPMIHMQYDIAECDGVHTRYTKSVSGTAVYRGDDYYVRDANYSHIPFYSTTQPEEWLEYAEQHPEKWMNVLPRQQRPTVLRPFDLFVSILIEDYDPTYGGTVLY